MSSKTLLILAVILIVLAAGAGFKIYSPNLMGTTPNPYTESIKDLNENNISKIEITKKQNQPSPSPDGIKPSNKQSLPSDDGSLTLSKVSNIWKVDNKKADQTKVQAIIKKILNSNQAELVSETNLKHKDFEVSDDLATQVKLGDTTFLVGKSGGGGNYIRLSGSDSVYLLKDLTSSDISTTPKDWLDLTVVAIDKQNIKRLKFMKTDENFSIIPKDGKWKLETGEKEVKSEKIDPILTQLASFKANDLATTAVSGTPDLTLNIEQNSSSETLNFFKQESDYIVERLSDKEKFTVSEFQVKDLLTPSKDLI